MHEKNSCTIYCAHLQRILHIGRGQVHDHGSRIIKLRAVYIVDDLKCALLCIEEGEGIVRHRGQVKLLVRSNLPNTVVNQDLELQGLRRRAVNVNRPSVIQIEGHLDALVPIETAPIAAEEQGRKAARVQSVDLDGGGLR